MRINGAQVFTGHRFEPLDVHIEAGRISKLTPASAANSSAEDFDALGCYLIPGMIDLHTHGYGGMDVMQGEEAIRHMARGLASHGVTAFLPTTVCATAEDTRAALRATRAVAQSPQSGAIALGSHMEGPFCNPARAGAQPPECMYAPSLDWLMEVCDGDPRVIKMLTIAPELPGAEAVCRALAGRAILSAGHTDATAEQLLTAAQWSVSHITHLFNGMNPLHHRQPGVAGAALSDERFSVQLIADLVHLHPAILKLVSAAKGPDRCVLISDAMMATDLSDGQYSLGGGVPTIVKDGVARLPKGNLAGSTLTLDRALRNMILSVGIAPQDAVRMASVTPALLLGDPERGHIAPGARADLALFDDTWSIVRTWVEGECFT